MKTVTVKNMVLGAGRTKIAVPLVAEDSDGLMRAAAQLRTLDFDLAEFRADFLKRADEADFVLAQLEKVREALPDTPLLFTFRRAAEGGSCPCGDDYYFVLLRRAAESGLADIIDIELLAGDGPVGEAAAQVKAAGAAVLLCNHDFERTPPKDVIAGRLKKMEALGADICKIAVMPHSPQDVLTLLDAAYSVFQTASVPLVAVSMGRFGAVSRIAGGMFGSAMTFAAAEKASAPGQINVGELRNILDVLNK
jgi:3-dehydroquinate dehydratase